MKLKILGKTFLKSEVLDSDFKNAFPGIFNLTVGILVRNIIVTIQSSNVADELKNLEILCKNPECSVYELENGKTPTHIIRDFVDEPTYAVEEIEMEQDYAIEMVDDFEIEVEDSEEPGIIEGIDFTSTANI